MVRLGADGAAEVAGWAVGTQEEAAAGLLWAEKHQSAARGRKDIDAGALGRNLGDKHRCRLRRHYEDALAHKELQSAENPTLLCMAESLGARQAVASARRQALTPDKRSDGC